MKKYMVMFVALFVAVCVAAPAMAAVEFKWGGQFRARYISQQNFYDGTDDFNDHNNYFDQRMRLYLTAIASENLRVVTRWEMGDTKWGNNGTGGRVGADERIVELKNAYLDFAIPCTPVRAKIGVQGIALMDAWIVDDDFSGAVFEAKFKPVTLQLGYIAAQKVTGGDFGTFADNDQNIDSFFFSADYAEGPYSASFVAFYQRGRDTGVSVDPATLSTPTSVASLTGSASSFLSGASFNDNNLWDVAIKFAYKVDWMSAYVSFIKNLGSVEIDGFDADYTGYAVDLGANFFYGPWTFNLGGFYISGPDTDDDGFVTGDDVEWFTYPWATSKYFSEIMGGGILDNNAPQSLSQGSFFRGYGFPTNVWTITAGAAYQVAPKTKVSASYWYFNTSSAVSDGTGGTTHDLGHEFDVYVTQGIVDGLTLDLVGAYMFTGDAFNLTGTDDHDNIYELGARLQWNF